MGTDCTGAPTALGSQEGDRVRAGPQLEESRATLPGESLSGAAETLDPTLLELWGSTESEVGREGLLLRATC